MAANLQSMCQYWKNFDLQELQKDLDCTASELAHRQEASEVARKRLVELSREFKKNTPEDVRKQVAPLLKSFQTEIDSLSKRCKSAEAAFLNIYKKLIDVPDPVPALEYALQIKKKAQRVQDLETENKQLRDTLAEYNHEFAEVKNQEVTIKQLKEKLREYDDKMESAVQAHTKEKEKELQRQFADKERHLQERQLDVAKKLGEAEQRAATLQSAMDSVQSELFDLRTKYDEATSAKSDEMEILMADLERANERATAAEREVERMRSQLASATQNLQQAEDMKQAPDMEEAINILKRSSLEVELAAKEKEVAQLVEDVQRLQTTVNKLRDSGSSMMAQLEEELSSQKRCCHLLEQQLKAQQDYDELKRELSVLKSIEFPGGAENIPAGGAVDGAKPKSLEMLLMEKNRTLQTENTQLKLANTEVTGPPEGAPSNVVNTSSIDTFANLLGRELAASYSVTNHHRRRHQFHHQIAPPHDSNGQTPETPQAVVPPMVISPLPLTTAALTNGYAVSQTKLSSPLLSHALDMRAEFPGGQSPLTDAAAIVPLHRHMSVKLEDSDTNGVASSTPRLDTADIASRIREILSSHNIGQRMFAKHVLGLSQGTVSELLSKPKHWEKLTEKGRESYRKMFAWAAEEQNVQVLKAISPKKGQPVLSSLPKHKTNATDERIVQILCDAQAAMQGKVKLEHEHSPNNHQPLKLSISKHNSGRPPEDLSRPNGQTVVPPCERNGVGIGVGGGGGGGGESHRGRKARTDCKHLNEDIVARIYREELAKLADAAERNGNMAECLRYRQELNRLMVKPSQPPDESSTTPQPPDTSQDALHQYGSSNGDSVENFGVEIKMEVGGEVKCEVMDDDPNMPQDLSMSSCENGGRGRHPASAFTMVRTCLASTPNGVEQPLLSATPPLPPEGLSPLQRMQSIANSLMAKLPPGGVMPAHQQRPLKAVLPQIRQEQFDRYVHIDTDKLVQRVKEALSQYSISQRLFGEHVLGLSQGSVSDLLARPKPWNMLTQKGREPFIRMQIFLEDPDAVIALVSNQYRLPADQLAKSFPPAVAVTAVAISAIAASHSSNSSCSGSPAFIPNCIKPLPLLPSPTPPPPIVAMTMSTPPPVVAMTMSTPPPTRTPTRTPPVPPPPPPPPPMPCELTAHTAELDTLAITSAVKEMLQYNNLGQKLFGEVVLGLSQGSVSELLSKPKPWHALSLKGREPFVKMQLWLEDAAGNIETLRLCQSQRKSKKRRPSADTESVCPSTPGSGPEHPTPPLKKARMFFTRDQKEALREAYARDPYPNQVHIEQLANQLGVNPKTVINWFHNHRMRAKQQQHGASPAGGAAAPFAPFPGKSEPGTDTVSTHSIDSMSAASNDSVAMSRNTEGATRCNSDQLMSQWLFPQFEAVPMVAPSDAEKQGAAVKRECESPSQRSHSSSPAHVTSDPLPSTNQVKREVDEKDTCKENSGHTETSNRDECGSQVSDEQINMKNVVKSESVTVDTGDVVNTPPTDTVPNKDRPTVNRRKRAKPQWVYEGTQLERLHGDSGTKTPPGGRGSSDEGDNRSEKGIDCFGSREIIEKMQLRIQSADIHWEEVNRCDNIDRIHHSILQEADDAWEF